MKETTYSEKKPHVIFLFLGGIVATLLWGSAFPALKKGFLWIEIDSNNIGSQMLFAGIRFFLAGIIVLIIGSIIYKKIIIPTTKRSFKGLITLGLTQTFLQYFFYYIGIAHVTGTKGSMFNCLGTTMTVILGMIFYHTKPTILKTLGMLLSISGIVFMCISNVAGKPLLLGEGMLVLSSTFSAIGSIANKEITKNQNPVMVAGWHLLIGGALLSILGLLMHGTLRMVDIKSYAILGYLVFISASTFSIWSWLLKHFSVENVSVFKFLIPIFGTSLSCIFLGEKLQIEVIFALILVSLGIFLVLFKRNRRIYSNQPKIGKQ